MTLVMGISDHVVVLDAGVPIASGPPAVVRRDPAVLKAYLGGAMSARPRATAVVGPRDRRSGGAEAHRGLWRGAGARRRGVRGAAGRDGGHARRQRRRQVDHHARGHRACCGRSAATSSSTTEASRGSRRIASRQAAWRWCRKAARCSPSSPCTTTLCSARIHARGCRYEPRSSALLERFPRLRERLHSRAGLLSGGEQQMLAIARGLMAKPRILLLDEPSLGLAPAIINELFEILAELRDEGITILLVDQMAALALTVADRGYVLESGRIVRADAAPRWRRIRRWKPPISAGPRRRSKMPMPLDLVLRQARIAGKATPLRHRHRGRPDRRHRAADRELTFGRSSSTAVWSSPGFVETHIHLDKSCILDRCSSEQARCEEAIAEVAARQARLHRGRRLCARPPHAGKGDRAGHDAHAHPCRGRSARSGLRSFNAIAPAASAITPGRSILKSASSRRKA